MFGNFSSFTTPSPNSFVSLFYLIYFVLPPFEENRLPFWAPGVLLPAFRSCFVEFAQCSNDLSMNLWGRKWSPCPIPPPSSEHMFLRAGILTVKSMFIKPCLSLAILIRQKEL